VVGKEMDGYEERRKRNDWYDKECQIKTKQGNKAQIKMLNRTKRMNT
jgi:allantoicase